MVDGSRANERGASYIEGQGQCEDSHVGRPPLSLTAALCALVTRSV